MIKIFNFFTEPISKNVGRRSRYIYIKEGEYYKCSNLCGKKYKYKRGVRRHLSEGCKNSNKFICTYCNESFIDRSDLKCHAMVKHCSVKMYNLRTVL